MKIEKNTAIGEIIKMCPDAAAIFMGYGMFCVSCPSAQSETLEEACFVHGIDVNELLETLNKFIGSEK